MFQGHSQGRESRGATPTSTITAATDSTPTEDVWRYFTRASGGKTAKCKSCDTIFKTDGDATIGLAVHLRNAHRVLVKRVAEDGPPEEVTTTPVGSSKHATANGGGKNLFGGSPLNGGSPTKLSRLEEKNALVGLNNRLAVILDKNRQLELENNRLANQLHTAEETLTVTTNKLKTTFEKENSDVRKKLEDADKDRVRLELANNNLQKDFDELAKKLKSRDQDLQQAQKSLKDTEAKLSTSNADLKKAKDEKDKLAKEKKELSDENAVLKKNQDDLRKQLESEAMGKMQLESKARDQAQDLTLKSQTYEQQIALLSVKSKSEVKAVGEQLQQEYKAKLEEAIKTLREDCNAQIANNKEDQDKLYSLKEDNLRKQLEKTKTVLKEKNDELESIKKKLTDAEKKLQALDNENYNLQKKLKDTESSLKEEQTKAVKDKKVLEADLREMRDDKDKLINEYQDLMEVKVALDNEIAVYRGLLEGEEERLRILVEGAADGTGTPRGSPEKRKGQKQGPVAVAAN